MLAASGAGPTMEHRRRVGLAEGGDRQRIIATRNRFSSSSSFSPYSLNGFHEYPCCRREGIRVPFGFGAGLFPD